MNKSVLSEVEEWLGVECSDKKPSSEDGEEYTVRAILCEDSGLVSKIMSSTDIRQHGREPHARRKRRGAPRL